MRFLAQVLPWVLPPVLGAIIGYVTNAIAIRMLFRPFREIRVFGIRLPFTPGLIPRQRGGLAESMARMVSTELLTVDAVRSQIRTAEFRDAMRANVEAITAGLLETRLGDIAETASSSEDAAPGDGAAERAAYRSVAAALSAVAAGFTRSDLFRSLLREITQRLIDELSARPAASILGAGGPFARLFDALTGESGRTRVREAIGAWTKRQFDDDIALSRFLSPEDAAALGGVVDTLYPTLTDFLVRWLNSDAMRRELAVRGRYLVQDVIDRLSGIQRFIITAAQYQRTLDENMDGIINDALDSVKSALADPENRKRIIGAVVEEVSAIRDRTLTEVVGIHRDAVVGAAETAADRVVTLLAAPESRLALARNVLGGDDGETVGDLLGRIFDLGGKSPGEFLSGMLLADGESFGGLAVAAGGIFRDIMRRHGERTLGAVLGMEREAKAGVDAALTEALLGAIDARTPEILASVNVRSLVVQKIDSLDIEEVEGLLLQVIERHLRYINIFGGLLGGLIGLIQDLLRVLNVGA